MRHGTYIGDKISYTDDGFNKIRTAPLWFVRFGYINNGTLNSSGSVGFYWSNTVGSGDGAYGLTVYNDGLRPAIDNSRYFGFSLRCLAR